MRAFDHDVAIWYVRTLFYLSAETAYRTPRVYCVQLLTGCCGFSQADFSSDVRIKWANKKVMSHSLIA